jgi:hypothetical protein
MISIFNMKMLRSYHKGLKAVLADKIGRLARRIEVGLY